MPLAHVFHCLQKSVACFPDFDPGKDLADLVFADPRAFAFFELLFGPSQVRLSVLHVYLLKFHLLTGCLMLAGDGLDRFLGFP